MSTSPRPRRQTQWLTTPQMAQLLDFHPKTLLHYANSHRVPREYATKVGRRWRWRADFAEHPIFLDVPWQ